MKYFLLGIGIAIICSCSPDDVKLNKVADDFFKISEYKPNIIESDSLILRKSILKVVDDENIILYNGLGKKFIFLRKDGTYYEIGHSGRGPEEYEMFANVHATSKALYVHDLSDLSIIRYPFDRNQEATEIFIEGQLIDVAVDEKNQRIMVFANKIGEDNVLFLYDFEGNLIKNFYKPESDRFKLFSYRFRYGELKFMNERFYFMYPDNNDIVELNSEGIILDTLFFTDKSSFNSQVPEMPQNLDPFRIDGGAL